VGTEHDHNQADAQIQAHRQAHQQKVKKLFIGLGAVAVLVIVLLIAMSFMGEKTEENTSLSNKTSPLSMTEITAYRDAFQAALTDYEMRLQEQVNEMKVVGYAPAKTADLALLKQSALTAFAQGAFSESKTTLAQLSRDTEALIAQWESDFSEQLLSAQSYFEQEDIPQAQLSLNKALALIPHNLEALALQSRIDAYSEIEFLLADLKVAKIERNLAKQIDLLSDIIHLDPQRNMLQTDLSNAQTQLSQQQLANALQQAEQAIEANDLRAATEFIQTAKAIDKNSKGAEVLTQRIAKLRQQQGLSQILSDIKAAKAQDNWSLVQQLSTQALKTHANNQDLLSAQQQAQRILQTRQQLAQYITRPARLADNNIRENAKQAMSGAFALSLQSPNLQKQLLELGELLDSYDSPVEVTIQSDEKTYIIVVGVGHVGKHASKTISLTPGEYVLEGKREGYKSKRLPITVSSNTPITVALVCDEAI